MSRVIRLLMASEIAPVSSETMTTMESASSTRPSAARWRVPQLESSSSFVLRGKRQEAAATRPLRTITAPSCKGVNRDEEFGRDIAVHTDSRIDKAL